MKISELFSLASHFNRIVEKDTINRLKRSFDLIRSMEYQSREEARQAVFDAIEREGLRYDAHGVVGYLNPDSLYIDPVENIRVGAKIKETSGGFVVEPKIIEYDKGKEIKQTIPPGPYTFNPDLYTD